MMVDPSVAALTSAQAVGIGIASMVGSWVVYDLLCRSPLGQAQPDPRRRRLRAPDAPRLGPVPHRSAGGRPTSTWGPSIGTIMAANVFFVIIPRPEADGGGDARRARSRTPADGERGKQRSVHNNYFTLPVVFIMISNHYSATYGHPYAWAILALIGAAGVLIRHFFNKRHKGVNRVAVPGRRRPRSWAPLRCGPPRTSRRFPRSRGR